MKHIPVDLVFIKGHKKLKNQTFDYTVFTAILLLNLFLFQDFLPHFSAGDTNCDSAETSGLWRNKWLCGPTVRVQAEFPDGVLAI